MQAGFFFFGRGVVMESIIIDALWQHQHDYSLFTFGEIFWAIAHEFPF